MSSYNKVQCVPSTRRLSAQATPAKGKAGKVGKAAAAEEDPDTTEAMENVASAIAKLPDKPGMFSVMARQEGGGYQQGGDSVPPPRHGAKVSLMLIFDMSSTSYVTKHNVLMLLNNACFVRLVCPELYQSV